MIFSAAKLGRPIEILLVEDSPTDAGLTRHALASGKVSNRLHVVEDGEQALEFLRRQGSYDTVPRPDLVLLDLNLPRKSGREVLSEIRADEQLKRLIVIILTTSQDDDDVLSAYSLNANAYITKPVDLDQFIASMQAVDQFWCSVVTLPPNDSC
jgi:two-component system, chemotaxis family, response regulator Rcp1